MKNKKIYQINWWDITVHDSKEKKEILKEENLTKFLTRSETYGYIIKEDRKTLIVVTTDNENIDFVAIPKGCLIGKPVRIK